MKCWLYGGISFGQFRVACLSRKGSDDIKKQKTKNGVFYLIETDEDIAEGTSSTLIRKLIRAGQPVDHLTSPSIAECIE